MPEFFLELFSEEIPPEHQIDAQKKIKELFEENLKKQTIIGGGLSSYKELKTLRFNTNITKGRITNLEGVILGKAFYLGKIEIKKGNEILKNLEKTTNA